MNYTPFAAWKMIATILISKTYKIIMTPFCIEELWVDSIVNGAGNCP